MRSAPAASALLLLAAAVARAAAEGEEDWLVRAGSDRGELAGGDFESGFSEEGGGLEEADRGARARHQQHRQSGRNGAAALRAHRHHASHREAAAANAERREAAAAHQRAWQRAAAEQREERRLEAEASEVARARALEEKCREAQQGSLRDSDAGTARESVFALRRCMQALRHFAQETRQQRQKSQEANEEYAHDIMATSALVQNARSMLAKLEEEQKEQHSLFQTFRKDQLESVSKLLKHMGGGQILAELQGSSRSADKASRDGSQEGSGEDTDRPGVAIEGTVARVLDQEEVPTLAGPEDMSESFTDSGYRVLDAVD